MPTAGRRNACSSACRSDHDPAHDKVARFTKTTKKLTKIVIRVNFFVVFVTLVNFPWSAEPWHVAAGLRPYRIQRVSGLPMLLTLPAERRFRSVAIVLTEKLAEGAGVGASDARRLGSALSARIDALCDAAAEGADLEVAFDMPNGEFRVRARCQDQGFELTA